MVACLIRPLISLDLEIYFLAYQIAPRRICIYVEDVGLAARVLGAK